MRIGVDIRPLMDDYYGGVSEYAYNLVRSITEADKDNEYALFYNARRGGSPNIQSLKRENVSFVEKRIPNKLFNLGCQKILKAPKLDRLAGADIFFAPNMGFISLSKNCPKVLAVHDVSFLKHSEFFSLKRKLWHFLVDIKRFARQFDLIIAVSQSTKNDLVGFCGLDPERIKVVYSGISRDFFREKSSSEKLSAAREKYGLPERFIFSLSAIEPRKNLDGLIRAFDDLLARRRRFRGLELVIAGIPGWKQNRIFAARERSRFKEKIRFIGYVDRRDKKAIYELSELFVYASHYEGFGFPPLEAMAAGCPVIVSANSSLAEIMGAAALPVNGNKISHLSRALALIASGQSLREDLIKKGKKLAEGFFWEKTAQEYISLFNGLKR